MIDMKDRSEETLEARLAEATRIATTVNAKKIELIGTWLWVKFSEKPSVETRTTLKENGFTWHAKRKCWVYAGLRSGGRGKKSLGQLRVKYGAAVIAGSEI